MDEPNPHSEWRLKLARTLAPAYISQPGVAAAAVCGSVARGWADRYSDVELAVWWHRVPTAEDRARCVRRIAESSERRDLGYKPDLDAWNEDFLASGMKVDVRHSTVDGQDRLLAQVVDAHDTSVAGQQSVAEVVHAVGLHGADLLDRWRQRADPYPDGLARAMVEANLRFGPNAWIERLAERDDVLPLAEISVTVVRAVFGVLLGLNRIYHPGYKWMDRTLASMTIRTTGLPVRVRTVLENPVRTRVAELERLVEDTIRLVEQEAPEIDTTAVRARVDTPARIWEGPPRVPPG